MLKTMSLMPRCRCLLAAMPCAALIACAATTDLSVTAVARTAAPQDYEKTITNFFAFKLPGPQKNTHIAVAQPEPGDCALGRYSTSMRGWVVPVFYRTFSGELASGDTIQINEKQYYFWFHGNTIAGISRRLELCPGLGTAFGDSDPSAAVAARLVPAATEAPAGPEASPRGAARIAVKADRAKGGGAPRAKEGGAPQRKKKPPP